jgi:NAD(P)-dependent dehydrogenase (short-subunit alcohol dehydrogenase family)
VPHMLRNGFGKIINISTSDVTMVRVGYSPYGPVKAGLEAMSRVWAQDLEGTGVTVNVFLPGGATDTRILPDMPSKRGADGGLLEPGIMRAPVLWLCADQSNGHTSERYIARLWDASLPVDEAAASARDRHHEKPGIL